MVLRISYLIAHNLVVSYFFLTNLLFTLYHSGEVYRITARTTTTPDKAWNNPSHVIRYYSKKVKQ